MNSYLAILKRDHFSFFEKDNLIIVSQLTEATLTFADFLALLESKNLK